MTTESTAANHREPQVAIVPLDQVALEDMGLAAAHIDDWLRAISDDMITLERLQHFAGCVPVIGNIMALVDTLSDIVTLSESVEVDPLVWVSLGINLIGVIPAPPNMAAARMTLRPMLALARQHGKKTLGDALIAVAVGHLNASIVGTIDNFLDQTEGMLPTLLEDCGTFCEGMLNDLASGLDAMVNGTFDAQGELDSAELELSTWWHDPESTAANFLSAVASSYKAGAKGLANAVAKQFVPDKAKALVAPYIRTLRDMGPRVRQQLKKLADPNDPNSLESLRMAMADAADEWWVHNNSVAGNVKPEAVSTVTLIAGMGALEVVRRQMRGRRRPKPQKNGSCPGTCKSISFATGAESLQHTDFSLPGPFALEWTRTYCSALEAYDEDVMGARWITEFTSRFDCVDDGLVFHDADGRSHAYPIPTVSGFHYDSVENFTLIRTGEHQLLLCRGYDRKETYVRHGQRFVLKQVVLRNGAGVMLHHEHRHNDLPVLSDVITYQDELTDVHLHLGTLIDEHGRLTGLWEIRDGQVLRQLCAYHYDAAGDLCHAQDEHGAAWNYQYQHHLITRYTDRTGRGMNLQWQGSGADARAVREWADDGSSDTRLEWDENIRLTYVTDALGHETWHYYDLLGYTYRIRHPDDRSEWFFRDQAKNVIRHVHTDGSQDRYTYSDCGDLLQHIRADHTTVHYAYDDQSQLIKIRDAEGGLWLRDYNERGHLLEATDPLGNKTEYAYTPSGLVSAIKDANGNEKAMEYNAAGQLLKYTDCSGKLSAWAYDDYGNLVQFTDAAGHATHYAYKAGQLSLVTHPDNTEERFERDAEGRLLAHLDALDRCTTWRYNAAGLISERVDAAQQTLHYRWDPVGRLVALENENERRAHFHYDPMGRLLEERGFDGRATRYTYEASTGRLHSTLDGERSISLRFDAMGRLTERSASLSSQGNLRQRETFAYDGNGQLIMASNDQSRVQWFHDPAGNLVREHQHYLGLQAPVVAVWKHEYDVLNQRVATLRPDGHRVSWLTYGSGHLLGLRLDDHDLLSYERDDLHREVARHQGNHLLQTQRWNPMGRLQEQLLGRSDDNSTLLKRAYVYDAAGQLTDIDDTRRGPLAYRYDPVGRLLQAASRLGVETFAFDPAGNLRDDSVQQEHRPLDQDPKRSKLVDNLLREYAGTHYAYDERGNQTQRWHNGRHSRLRWDLFDRLVHFEDARLAVEFAYDALGRRLFKHSSAHYKARREAGSQWNRNEHERKQRELGCGFTLYGWDGDNLAWESSPAQYEGDTGRTVHYLFEPGSFVPVAQAVRHEGIRLIAQPTSSQPYNIDDDPVWTFVPLAKPFAALAWYQCDHLGTPQELTDHFGQVAWSAQYKAWGEVKEQRSEWAQQQGVKNPIRFQGQYHDHETGLHYNRHRYYDPGVGRFVSKDPISYAGGLNLYVYAPNPVGWVDPLGLAGYPVKGSTVGPDVMNRGVHVNVERPGSHGHVALKPDTTGTKIVLEPADPAMRKLSASQWKKVCECVIDYLDDSKNLARLSKSARAGIDANPKSNRVPEFEKVEAILKNHQISGTNPVVGKVK